ncbi:MAG: hypothetical protein LUC91_03490 [Prevotella sp.]|nr:hypothetical protein [Prevotella sp.]
MIPLNICDVFELGRSAMYEMDEETGEIRNPQGFYKGNKQNGLYQEWFDDGKTLKMSCEYKDGKRNGRLTSYYQNGVKSEEADFVGDKLNGDYRSWRDNGVIEGVYHFKDGKQDGVQEDYYSNGNVRVRETFKDGKRNGVSEGYSMDTPDRLEYRHRYKNGELDGLQETWDENGRLTESYFKDGERVESVDRNYRSLPSSTSESEDRNYKMPSEGKETDVKEGRKTPERKPKFVPDENFKLKTKDEGATYVDVVEALQKAGKAKAHDVYNNNFFDVGETSDLLKEYGVTGIKFTIGYGVIADHFNKDGDHDLPLETWKKLPDALRNPLAIMEYYKDGKRDGFRIYTRINYKDEDGKTRFIIVGTRVKSYKEKSEIIEVNAIATVFGRKSVGETEVELYRSKNLTPDEESLLGGPNSHPYTPHQESGAKVGENSDIKTDEGVNSSSNQYRMPSSETDNSLNTKDNENKDREKDESGSKRTVRVDSVDGDRVRGVRGVNGGNGTVDEGGAVVGSDSSSENTHLEPENTEENANFESNLNSNDNGQTRLQQNGELDKTGISRARGNRNSESGELETEGGNRVSSDGERKAVDEERGTGKSGGENEKENKRPIFNVAA